MSRQAADEIAHSGMTHARTAQQHIADCDCNAHTPYTYGRLHIHIAHVSRLSAIVLT